MAKKKKKTVKERLEKARKARLRQDMLKDNYFQRTKEKTHKSDKTYSRKNQKPPSVDDNDV